MQAKPRPPFARLGFWSAVLTAVFSILFTVGVLVGGILPRPWDVVIPIGASLLLAPSFVVMMVSVHYAAPAEKKIWSHIGITFAVLYAALVSMVYVTWLFVVEPHVLRGGWLCLLYGLGALMVFLSYVFYIIPLGAGWFIFPPLAILLAVYFRRAGNTAR